MRRRRSARASRLDPRGIPVHASLASPDNRTLRTFQGGTMKNTALRVFAGVAFGAVMSAAALAQQPPAAPAPVPEQMPFDIPYGTPIALEQAMKVAAAAEAEAKKHNWKMNIAVVGPGGELKYFVRMDGAQLDSA